MDSTDPMQGWSFKEFLLRPRPTRNDLYGSLYFYLQEQLQRFCKRIATLQIHFQLFELNALHLPNILKEHGAGKNYLDRIEVRPPTPEHMLSIFPIFLSI